MPFFGPSLAGRSNSSTGTRALTRCAAICAPITPAPSTATLRMLKLLTGLLRIEPRVAGREDAQRMSASVCLQGKAAPLCRQTLGSVVRAACDARRPAVALEQRFVDVHHRLRAGARETDRRRRLGQQAREVEARGRELRLVERIARRFVVEGDARHACPEVREHQVTDGAQVRHGGRPHLVRILHRLHADFHRQLLHLFADVGKRRDEFGHLGLHAFRFGEFGDDLAELLQLRAHVAQHLAAEQVERLNRIGPFIDHVDPRVAHVLLHAPLGDEAVAAVDLHRVVRALERVVGQERLDDRREQRDEILRFLAHRLVGVRQRLVDLQRGPVRERARAFRVRLLREQHAAHVRVNDDRVGRLVRRLRPRQRAHLQALLRVRERVLVSDFGEAEPLHADAEARGVHHHEHRVQALVRLADQPALRVVEIHHAGRVAVDAHLVLDRAALHAVALARLTRCVGHELRHDEQRNALRALRRVRQAREHEVNDVLREIVFAARDEDLGAADRIRAVAVRLGLRAQDAEIGAAVRLGQAHRARPFARYELRQIELLQLGRAVRVQALVCAVRQARIHRPRLVRRVQHFIQRVVDERGQALAAVIGIAAERGPARVDVLLVRFLEARRRLHDAVADIRAALAVADLVEREKHLRAELARFLEHLVDRVGVEISMLGHLLDLGFDVQKLVQHELHVAQRRGVLSHDSLQDKAIGSSSPAAVVPPLTALALVRNNRLFKRGPREAHRIRLMQETCVVVQAEREAVQLEEHQVRIRVRAQMPFLLRLRNGAQQRGAPRFHARDQLLAHRAVRAIVVFHRAADVDAPRRHLLDALLDPAREHRPQARQTARLAQARKEHLVLETMVVLSHDFDLQIVARSEVREHAALAHLHTLGQQADRQTFQPVPAGKVQCCFEYRGTRLFAFSHSFLITVQGDRIKSNGRTIIECGRRRNKEIIRNRFLTAPAILQGRAPLEEALCRPRRAACVSECLVVSADRQQLHRTPVRVVREPVQKPLGGGPRRVERRVDLAAVGERRRDRVAQRGRLLAVAHEHDVRLVVQHQAERIQIRRADGRPMIVDHRDLAVQHRLVVFGNAHARAQQCMI
ncbi:hypothetical protein BURPS1710b_0856 [Burkholderia pseudomallei 1710b]|uniref:Uncharacterized protein n=1 Tax=Burkholderia pseudomallei (strain 1710b) TaxID=320372 RepID=Q3JVY5_BURP1|nr:hypothetical protein BURPS1710b_0856 [Burkholderia pseudomallei 1710b]